MTRAVLPLVLALTALAAGCGGGGESADTEATDTNGHEGVPVVVYFLRDGQVWPVERMSHLGAGDARSAMSELLEGPTDDESELGLTSEVPSDGITRTTVSGGTASVEAADELSDEARAQIVYTVTRDAGVTSVEIDGASYTRADFEEQTPSVLVESPLAFGGVSSPLTARGTANTFEATFQFEILDEGGEVIAGDFVTATSGTGTRGTFRFEQPFVALEEQDGALVVFELSAEDGSRIHEVEIPLRLVP